MKIVLAKSPLVKYLSLRALFSIAALALWYTLLCLSSSPSSARILLCPAVVCLLLEAFNQHSNVEAQRPIIHSYELQKGISLNAFSPS